MAGLDMEPSCPSFS